MTKRILQEVGEYIKNNPKSTVYTNSETFRDMLQKCFPKSKVEVLKTFPDKSYPNLFFVDNVEENFSGKEPHGN